MNSRFRFAHLKWHILPHDKDGINTETQEFGSRKVHWTALVADCELYNVKDQKPGGLKIQWRTIVINNTLYFKVCSEPSRKRGRFHQTTG